MPTVKTPKKVEAPKPEKPSFEEKRAFLNKVAELIRTVEPDKRLSEHKQKLLRLSSNGVANYAEALAFVGQKVS